MLMEYSGEGTDLHKLFKNKKDGYVLTELNIKIIIKKILKGLRYFHSKGICHRDIKPNNIFLNKDLTQVKILDFNVAVELDHGE
jgi:serine/threonine protein kinase